MSAASFHWPRTLSHTTRYFPEISFGDGPLLVRLKVPLSPAAKVALSNVRPPAELLAPKAYRLPNGQVITPKVTIRFTKEE